MVKKIPRSFYPNAVTVINIFLGFYSVLFSFKGEFMFSFWCIVGGGIADALDGKVARMVKGYSEFGVQYDSLADVITFGLAPSVLVYNLLNQPDNGVLIWLSFLPLLFGSMRLARFNADLVGFDKDSFVGLPIPAAAYSIVSIVPLSRYLETEGIILSPIWVEYDYIFFGFVLFYSLLMMSTLKYDTLSKFVSRDSKNSILKIITVAILLPFVIIYTYAAFFPIMFLFSITGLINWVVKPKESER